MRLVSVVGWRLLALVIATTLMIASEGCKKSLETVQHPESQGGQLHPYTAALEPDDGQWIRATKDYANTRYSTLDQINTSNVARLQVAWTFNTGVNRGQEAAPIVANNTCMWCRPGRTSCSRWTLRSPVRRSNGVTIPPPARRPQARVIRRRTSSNLHRI
jgi:glucose dehydrogenase